ncbi:MAG: hypothetical protein U0840_10925 [Gemmataceae bacterium]
MSDPLAQLLQQFTPQRPALDRDALMYQAGRASVPSPARWKLVAAVLALTQTLTLALLLAQPHRPAPVPTPMPAPLVPEEASPGGDPWALRVLMLETPDKLPVPPQENNLVPDVEPLRVFTAWKTIPLD